MKQYIKQIINKLFCSHKWEEIERFSFIKRNDDISYKVVITYICNNCGKIHKEFIL